MHPSVVIKAFSKAVYSLARQENSSNMKLDLYTTAMPRKDISLKNLDTDFLLPASPRPDALPPWLSTLIGHETTQLQHN